MRNPRLRIKLQRLNIVALPFSGASLEIAYANYKNFFEGQLDEENVIPTLYPVNEEIVEDHQGNQVFL